VDFAREHRVRLVVKGGGHSYVAGSNAPDSLLIWTRPNMRAVQLHDRLCPGRRRPGTAAANLLEAEVVTPDGAVRTANAASNPDLFWALKGGGGGTFGAVTRLTLRTHALPAYVGAVRTMITAASDAAHATLAGQPAAHRYLAIPAMASRRMSVALPTRRKTAQPHHRYLSR